MNQHVGTNLPELQAPVCLANIEIEDDGRSILVVEDESFLREVTREVLISAGYRVFVAKDAIEAMQIYEEHCLKIDLVITDLVLPGETGRSLAVRLNRKNPKLEVLFMSGYQNQFERDGKWTKYFLMKPFSSSTLLNRLEFILNDPTLPGGFEIGSGWLPAASSLDDLSWDICQGHDSGENP